MEQQYPASTAHLHDLDPLERVRRFLDERERPTPFAPEGFLPTDWLARITRTGDTLLVSDLRDLLDRAERYDRLVEGVLPLARELQSLVSRYTRAPGENGDRVADLLSEDAYRIGTALLASVRGER